MTKSVFESYKEHYLIIILSIKYLTKARIYGLLFSKHKDWKSVFFPRCPNNLHIVIANILTQGIESKVINFYKHIIHPLATIISLILKLLNEIAQGTMKFSYHSDKICYADEIKSVTSPVCKDGISSKETKRSRIEVRVSESIPAIHKLFLIEVDMQMFFGSKSINNVMINNVVGSMPLLARITVYRSSGCHQWFAVFVL